MKRDTHTIPVVVPDYNVVEYLLAALDSLIAQERRDRDERNFGNLGNWETCLELAHSKMRLVTAGWPLGAAMAYSSELFRRFPRINSSCWRGSDDDVYTCRARMSGGVLEIPDRLVKYRMGSGESSSLWKIRNQIRCKIALSDIQCLQRVAVTETRS